MSNILLPSDGIAIRQGIYEQKVSQETELGRFIDFEDGRRFRYCQADGNIEIGHMCASGAVDADDNTVTQTGMTVALSNGYIGEKVINVILATATTLNLYAEGTFCVEGGVGLGQFHKVRKNKAGGAAVATPCELTLYDPLVTALDATSIITLTKCKYKDVVQNPTAIVGTPIGVPLIAITDNYFFWAQTRGYAPIMVDDDGAVTIGQVAVGTGGDPGAIVPRNEDTTKSYGVVVQVAAQDTYATIDLKLE